MLAPLAPPLPSAFHGAVNASPLIVTFFRTRFITAERSGLAAVVLRSMSWIVTLSMTFPLLPRIEPRVADFGPNVSGILGST